jgi:SpoIIAA-like
MYKVNVDEALGLVEIQQQGMIKLEEAQQLTAEVRRGIASLRGRSVKILVDTRFLHPVPPGVDQEMRDVQVYGLAHGVDRVAQVVESSVVLLQRNRIMREAGSEPMTRIFREPESARKWLLSGKEPDEER